MLYHVYQHCIIMKICGLFGDYFAVSPLTENVVKHIKSKFSATSFLISHRPPEKNNKKEKTTQWNQVSEMHTRRVASLNFFRIL